MLSNELTNAKPILSKLEQMTPIYETLLIFNN